MSSQGFVPVTWVQLCAAWWLCRGLALTSSAVDKLIVAAAPHIAVDHEMREHFERILAYTGQMARLDDSNSNENDDMSIDDCESVEISDGMVDREFLARLQAGAASWTTCQQSLLSVASIVTALFNQ